jgi:hypothetical protein
MHKVHPGNVCASHLPVVLGKGYMVCAVEKF